MIPLDGLLLLVLSVIFFLLYATDYFPSFLYSSLQETIFHFYTFHFSSIYFSLFFYSLLSPYYNLSPPLLLHFCVCPYIMYCSRNIWHTSFSLCLCAISSAAITVLFSYFVIPSSLPTLSPPYSFLFSSLPFPINLSSSLPLLTPKPIELSLQFVIDNQ